MSLRTLAKWIGRAVLALFLAMVVISIWKREELTRMANVITLFNPDRIVQNFSSMERMFLTTPLSRGTGPTSPLAYGPDMILPESVRAWIEERQVTSLLVMKDGTVRREEYRLGTTAEDRRISWSISKSYLSALLGTLIDDGTIPSLDVPVTDYAPRLAGSAYDGATLRNVLQGSSGVVFDEDYLDFNSDIQRMGRVVALGGTLDSFAASLDETFVEPGEKWTYVSMDAHVVGMVIRGATGRSIPDLLAERIIAPLGQEYGGSYITDGTGTAFVLGGLNLTTRDYARFGQMIAQNGAFEGQQILPAAWVADSILPSAKTEPGALGYGYQWWIPADGRPGEVMGRGIYGQYLYIDQQRQIVIVVTAANLDFREDGQTDADIAALRSIADSL